MNSLSWFIYIAGVVGSLGAFITFICTLFFFAAVAAFILMIVAGINAEDRLGSLKEVQEAFNFYGRAKKFGITLLCLGIFTGIFSALIPTTQTMYMIAASEAGEVVVTNPESAEIFDMMKNKIKEYLEPTVNENK